MFLRFTALTLIAFCTINKTNAFDTEGHKAIEQEAYRLLAAMLASGSLPDGGSIIRFLKKTHILNDDLSSYSHFPDISLERQFAQNRQMYHFMASVNAALEASKQKTKQDQQLYMLLSSLEPCYKTMYFFFREILKNSKGASQAGRGIYVLIHIVADSYSSEHTTREESSMGIMAIKSWQFSRLCWPKATRAKEDGKNTLLLLHRGFCAKGDHEWFDDQKKQLTPLAQNAAISIKDLLIAIYQAMNDESKAGSLITGFFEKDFKPFNSIANNGEFTFPNSNRTIKYDFNTEYNNSSNDPIFEVDRSPRHCLTATLQSDFSLKPVVSAFGVEYMFQRAPTQADNSKVFLNRIPHGYGVALSKFNLPGQNVSFASLLRTKIFVSASVALPIINCTLDPEAGAAIFPFSKSTNLSFAGGIDLVWSIGKDFGSQNTATKTVRFSVGYEFDQWSIDRNSHFIKLKLGFNTWHIRSIKDPLKKAI